MVVGSLANDTGDLHAFGASGVPRALSKELS